MKTAVVYYSGTGSCAKLAQAIRTGAGKKSACDLLWIKDADPMTMGQYDLIFLGSPIWFIRETANLREFVYRMENVRDKLCALFCSHGVLPEGFMYSLGFAVRRKGMKILGWGDWYADVRQVLHLPHPYYTTGHPDAQELAEAETFGEEMVERAERVLAGEQDLLPQIPKREELDVMWLPYRPKDHSEHDEKGRLLPPKMKYHREIDTKKCTYPGCTLCVDNCMAGAINLKTCPPSIRDDCINCAICDKLCPENAVVVDAATLSKRSKIVIHREKCQWPECTLCLEHCPMDCLDMTQGGDTVRPNHRCEVCCLCWTICPHGAIEIENMAVSQEGFEDKSEEGMKKLRGFTILLDRDIRNGRFRQYTPDEDIDMTKPIKYKKEYPRFSYDHDWLDSET